MDLQIEPVAHALLGAPNRRLSKETELRYGAHGSLSINITNNIWFDHEANEGGGVLALIKRRPASTLIGKHFNGGTKGVSTAAPSITETAPIRATTAAARMRSRSRSKATNTIPRRVIWRSLLTGANSGCRTARLR
jgi:hypothetical protein